MEIFTICSANYIDKAYCLYKSIKDFNKDFRFNLFLCEITKVKNIKKVFKEANVYYLNDIYYQVKNIEEIVSKYNITELNTCIKAKCFKFLFKEKTKVLYIDPDIEVFDELSDLNQYLDDYEALLTPHLLTPYDDLLKPSNIDILSSGTNNFGFLGLKKSEDTERFLKWWDKQLYENCFNDTSIGVFTDQKFGEFIPSFIKNVFVIKQPNYNVAYWNLHERNITKEGEHYFVNGEKLKFFHFSGLPQDLKLVSKHQNRIKVKTTSNTYKLIKGYKQKCLSYRSQFPENLKNDFTEFNNGEKFLEIHQTALRISGKKLTLDYKNNLIYEKKIFYKIQTLDIVLSSKMSIHIKCEPILAAVLKMRPDLVLVFHYSGEYPLELKDWFINGGFRDFGLKDHGFDYVAEAIFNQQIEKYILRKFLQRSKRINFLKRVSSKIIPKYYKSKINSYINKTPRKLVVNSKKIITSYNKRFNNFDFYKNFNSLNIHYVGYLNYPTGLGKAARDTALDISQKGNLSKLTYLDIVEKKATENFNPITNNKKTEATFFHCNFDSFKDVFQNINWDGLRILYIAWELPYFKSEWITDTFDNIDCLCVPSKFIANNLYRSYGIKSLVLPHIVDNIIPDAKSKEIIKNKYQINSKINFLISFDFASYSKRKNPEAALIALENSLKNFNDLDYSVIIKVHGSKDKNHKDFLNNIILKNKIIINKSLNDIEYASIQELSDIYISLHRSEGFGLNIAEMINRGKYVVSTGYSGNLDFCFKKKSYLVKYKLVRVNKDEYPYSENGQYWAEPDIKDASIKISKCIDSIIG